MNIYLVCNAGMSTSILMLIPKYTENSSGAAGLAIHSTMLAITIFLSVCIGSALYLLSNVLANDVFHKSELEYFITISSFTPDTYSRVI